MDRSDTPTEPGAEPKTQPTQPAQPAQRGDGAAASDGAVTHAPVEIDFPEGEPEADAARTALPQEHDDGGALEPGEPATSEHQTTEPETFRAPDTAPPPAEAWSDTDGGVEPTPSDPVQELPEPGEQIFAPAPPAAPLVDPAMLIEPAAPGEPRAPDETAAAFAAGAYTPEPRAATPYAGDAPTASADSALIGNITREEAKTIGVRAAKVAAIVFCGWFTVVMMLIVVYRFVNPPFSALMLLQWVGGTSINQQWVPLDSISPNLARAVIVSEDGRFCRHWGIDFAEVYDAIRRSSGGVPRGASTITMQVAKNLFLWPAKSYIRKVIEVPLTYAIELAWPKRRILEIYLNIAEWGPGIFGAEAAAKAHFGRPASRLSSRQAAQLAVALPNPFSRDAGDPGPWASQRATVIQRRAAGNSEAASCILGER